MLAEPHSHISAIHNNIYNYCVYVYNIDIVEIDAIHT
jgi:hypothetical protein